MKYQFIGKSHTERRILDDSRPIDAHDLFLLCTYGDPAKFELTAVGEHTDFDSVMQQFFSDKPSAPKTGKAARKRR